MSRPSRPGQCVLVLTYPKAKEALEGPKGRLAVGKTFRLMIVWKNLRNTHILTDIAEYLVSVKYAKARDHQEEVNEFSDTLDKCSADVFTVLYNRHATAGAVANPAQPAVVCPSSKASSSELKPEKLRHDSSTAVFRTWKKQFRAYYMTRRNSTLFLPCSQQQDYFGHVSIVKPRVQPPYTLPLWASTLALPFSTAPFWRRTLSMYVTNNFSTHARKRGSLCWSSEKSYCPSLMRLMA